MYKFRIFAQKKIDFIDFIVAETKEEAYRLFLERNKDNQFFDLQVQEMSKYDKVQCFLNDILKSNATIYFVVDKEKNIMSEVRDVDVDMKIINFQDRIVRDEIEKLGNKLFHIDEKVIYVNAVRICESAKLKDVKKMFFEQKLMPMG